MINLENYNCNYPVLASFASNPDSPTYNRRTKTGKTVVVRKGKRKKNKLAIAGGVGGALVGNSIASGVISGKMRALGLDPKGGLKSYQALHTIERLHGGKISNLLASLALVGGGAYAGHRIVKKLTDKNR